MNDAALKPDTQDIVVDEVFPHTPETIWKTLTTANLMGRWLMMPAGFEPVEGKHFTYQTTPAGEWDGTVHCQVLEVKPNERFAYAWKGGHEGNVGSAHGSTPWSRSSFPRSKTARASASSIPVSSCRRTILPSRT